MSKPYSGIIEATKRLVEQRGEDYIPVGSKLIIEMGTDAQKFKLIEPLLETYEDPDGGTDSYDAGFAAGHNAVLDAIKEKLK